MNLRRYECKYSDVDSKQVVSRFKEMHPDYFELTEWSKRVNYLDNNKLGLSDDEIMLYIIGKCESNFKIVSKLLELVDLSKLKTGYILSFINQKFTEVKLEKEILKLLGLLDEVTKVEFILSGAKFNVGKKAARYLELLEKIKLNNDIIKSVLNELNKIKYTGIIEKKRLVKSINYFNDKLNEESKADNLESNDIQPEIKERINIEFKKEDVVVEKIKEFEKIENEVIKEEEVDTNNLINVVKLKQNDLNNENYLNILNNNLINRNEVEVNDFIIFLVMNQIILNDDNILILISVLLTKELYYLLEVLDRIYPMSKLYKIYKKDERLMNVLVKIIGNITNKSNEIDELKVVIKEVEEFFDLLKILTNNKQNDEKNNSKVDFINRSLLEMSLVEEESFKKSKNEINVYEEIKQLSDENQIVEYFKNNNLNIKTLIHLNMINILSVLIRNNIGFDDHISDLLKLFRNDNDIMMGITLNSDYIKVLTALFDLVIEDSDTRIMKLIWRHSKNLTKWVDNKKARLLITTIDNIYRKHGSTLSKSTTTMLKVSLLHLTELCNVYSTNIMKFDSSKNFKEIASYITSNSDLPVEDIRSIFLKYKE